MWFSQKARSDTPEKAEASVVVVNCSFLAIPQWSQSAAALFFPATMLPQEYGNQRKCPESDADGLGVPGCLPSCTQLLSAGCHETLFLQFMHRPVWTCCIHSKGGREASGPASDQLIPLDGGLRRELEPCSQKPPFLLSLCPPATELRANLTQREKVFWSQMISGI